MRGFLLNTILLFLLCLSTGLTAQVTVSNSNNATFLAKKLIGPGVEISNATMLCNANQSGFFVSPATLLGMDSGIVLTTGLAATNPPFTGLNGPEINFANQNQGTGGDVDLNTLATISTYDRCVLEFDFKGDGDTIFFEYRFGSEEYPQFNCTNYNDVFGFFISGPGITGNQNLALIPNTSIPVAINSVNNGVVVVGGNISNCTSMGAGSPFTSLYVDNTGGADLTYGGFTTMFKAQSFIQSCSTYHIKLAIADGFDQIFDSGVFLKAGSFKSNTYHFSATTDSSNAGIPFTVEGCDSITLKIKRDNFQTALTADTVTLLIQGTATPGADYQTIGTTYTFSSSLSDTVKTIFIKPINDLITEGTESIKLYLKNQCNTIIDSIELQIKDPRKFTLFNSDTTICSGQSVSINGVYDNGLLFNWTPAAGVSNVSQFDPVLTPTVTTNYILTGSFGNCVPQKDTVKITVQPLPTLSLAHTNITCAGLNNGTLTATGTVGSAPLTFQIQPGAIILTNSPATFTNLSAGVYTVTITSGLGCSKTATRTIVEPPPMQWIAVTPTPIGCNAGNVGQISATASGGAGTLIYTLMPPNVSNTSGNYTGLAAGAYSVIVKDANNCSMTTNVSITQSTTLTWFMVNHTNVNCAGQSNGSIYANVSGSSSTITYSLTPGNVSNTNGSFSGLTGGTYTINALDASGCTAVTTVTITQPTAGLNLGTPVVTQATCFGSATGAVSITSSGGTGTVSFNLTPPGSTNTAGVFTGKPAGTYTIVATDVNGCTNSTTFIINQPPALNVVSNAVFPTCVPGNNGSIALAVTGGVPGYTYKLNSNPYQASGSFTGLSSGSYTLTVKDANNCTSSVIVPLQISNPLLVANNTIQPVCTDTSTIISVTASGGVAPYTYTLMPNNLTNNTGQFPGVDTGTYVITVVDASGCSNTIQVSILLPPELLFTNFSQTNIPCNGIGQGNISTSATGGVPPYTYSINPPGTTNSSGIFNSLTQGWYTVTAIDANGCTKTSVAHIIVSPPLSIGPPTLTHVSCYGTNTGIATINPIGGSFPMVYTLNPGGYTNITGTFSGLPAGTYTVSVLDAGNCTNTGTFTITQPPAFALTSISTTPPNCVPGNIGTITVNATGGTPTYAYSSGGVFQVGNTLTGLNVGNYTVTVKDANNCTQTTVVNLINPVAPSFNSVNVNQALCAGSSSGSLTINMTSGTLPFSYTISPLGITNSTGVFTNLPVNTYTITVSDAVNCVLTTTAIIQQPSVLSWSSFSQTNVSCNAINNGTITATASGGFGTLSYTLQPGNTVNATGSFANLTNNTYTLTATDANNCTLSTVVNITQPSALFWNGVGATNAACYNLPTAAINAPANGGAGIITYNLLPGSLSNTTGSFPTLLAGAYTVTATDANGCTITTGFTLTEPSSYPAFTTTNTIPTCVPGNDAIITVTATGGTPGYLYSVNGLPNQMSNVFTAIGISTYTVQVEDANGCTLTSTVPVINNNAPNFTNVGITSVLCFGANTGAIVSSVTGGVGALVYNLQPNNTSNTTGSFTALTAGNYTLSVTDANNCSATSNVILTQPPVLQWDSVDNRDVACYGGGNGVVTSSASGGVAPIVYQLMPSNVSNFTGIFFGLGVGQYTLTATDSNGCVVTAVFQINQPPPITWVTTLVTPATCVANADGSITVLATGGNGQFDYKLLPNNISNTTGFFPNLTVGTYTVVAKDFLNCTQTTVLTVLPGPPVTVNNLQTVPASCVPGCDGSAVVSATGGNGNYLYSNNNSVFQVSNTFTALCSGLYTVIVKDGNNCTGSATYIISTANGPSALNAVQQPVSCFSGTNGSLTTTIVGGQQPVIYTLQPGNISNNTGLFNSLSAQTYTISATDANGCSISTLVAVTQPALLQLDTPVLNPPSCFAGTNGSISISTVGGTGSMIYTLLPGALTNNTGLFTGLTAGAYTVDVVDANGCTAQSVVSLTQPLPVIWSSSSVVPIACFGGSNGSIAVVGSGGSGSMNYTLMPGNFNNSTGLFTGLGLNTYTVSVADANGCTLSTLFTITQPTPLLITNTTATIPTCIPGGDATITVTASGGTTNYSYSINNGSPQTSNQFQNLSLGVYTVMVIDANGCTVTSAVNVISPNSPVINSILTTSATCVPGCDGTATVTSSNGTGLHQYAINGGNFQTGNQFTNLCLNTYVVVVKDANGCTGSSNFVIVNPPPPVFSLITNTVASCVPGCDGSLTISTIGGTGQHQYSLNGSTFQTGNTFAALCANLYTITVRDAAGCTATNNAAVNAAVGPLVSGVNAISILCHGQNTGSIGLTLTGGTQPIVFTLLPINQTNSSGLFTNLYAGSYTLTATDNYGCTVTEPVTLTEPPPLQFGAVNFQPPTCAGLNNGLITAPVTGGLGTLTYTISPFGNFVSPSSFNGIAGNTTYSIQVVDANGCSLSTVVVVPDPPPLQINSVTTDSVTCFGYSNGLAQIQASGGTGGINFMLLPSALTNTTGIFNNLAGGTYSVVVSDANGCALTTTFFIFEPTPLLIQNAYANPISCFGLQDGNVVVIGTGGTPTLLYTLNPGNVVNTNGAFNNLSASLYTVVVTDNNQCSLSTTLLVQEPPPVVFSSVNVNNVQCNGLGNGQVTVMAQGGTGTITYVANPGAITNTSGSFGGLGVNIYTISATDANGCSTTTIISITQPPPLDLILDSIHHITCFGGNDGYIGSHATGGTPQYTYSLVPGGVSNSIGNFNGLMANVYALFVTDTKGCKDSIFPITLIQPPLIVFTSVIKEDITCYYDTSGSIVVVAAGGTGTIQFSLSPNVGVVSGNGSYDSLTAGTYTITATDSKGCTVTTTVTILSNLQIQATVDYTEPNCHGEANGSIQINASGGVAPLQYALNNNTFTLTNLFTNLGAGSYTVYIRDAKNCLADTLLILTEPDRVGALVDIKDSRCETDKDAKVTVIGTGGRGDYVYYLKPGVNINKTGIFTGLSSGVYTLTVKDSSNCEFDSILTIQPPSDLMEVDFEKMDIGCYGIGNDGWALAKVTGGTSPYSYLWNDPNATTTEKVEELKWGRYEVMVTDSNDCVIRDTVYIKPGICCDDVFIPNAFSPNNDGTNDRWRVITAAGVELHQLAVYNRWGNKIWSGNSIEDSWDGTYKGKKCDLGTYFYIFRYTCLSTRAEYVRKGDVTLVQ
jgi:gliding motility-associated-like protein